MCIRIERGDHEHTGESVPAAPARAGAPFAELARRASCGRGAAGQRGLPVRIP